VRWKKDAARLRVSSPDGDQVRTAPNKGLNMINDLCTATRMLTPLRLFTINYGRKIRFRDLSSLTRRESADLDAAARLAFGSLCQEDVFFWEMKSRAAIEQQPRMHNTIIDIMSRDPTLSWDQIAYETGDWCSGPTIGRYLREKMETGGYCRYTERFLPLLTAGQKRKHVAFAKHLRSLWGQGRGKYLWIHYDEKWFWGAVARMAKMCEAKGLSRQARYAYHKNFINKVMAICVVGYAFDGTPDDGGVGVKIAFTRAQCARIAQKIQKKASGVNAAGNTVYQGDVLRRKGDKYLVDVCVTGANSGTSDKPKFALLPYMRDEIFELVSTLVKQGGQFEGYKPVIQGDSAGPHVEELFKAFVLQYCAEKGWLWEPQGPQMPFSNACDLSVFPMLGKSHSHLTRKTTSSVAPVDTIWSNAKSVFQRMPACKIARSFVLAWRLALLVIKEKGGNTFLGNGGLHQQVGNDFHDTKNGTRKK